MSFNLEFERPALEGLVSVVIPVFRDSVGLVETLESLERQTVPTSAYEVIVSNDGDDPSVSKVCEEFSVIEVAITPNRGSYFARNRGLEHASGEFIAFVDADVVVPDHWIEVGKSALKSASYVGGPVIVDLSSATSPAHRLEASSGFRGNRKDNPHQFFVTANLFVRRNVFKELGGFDERLRSGGDNEFGRRVHESTKFKQRFEEALGVLHPPRSYKAQLKKAVRVAEGKEMLNRLYPERYQISQPTLGRLLRRMLVPPRPSSVRRNFEKNPHYGFATFYLFSWRRRAAIAFRLLKFQCHIRGRIRGRNPTGPPPTMIRVRIPRPTSDPES